ncbi:MAG TPA: hypothetical protein V6C93_08575 [Allocoleopsis sp.]
MATASTDYRIIKTSMSSDVSQKSSGNPPSFANSPNDLPQNLRVFQPP